MGYFDNLQRPSAGGNFTPEALAERVGQVNEWMLLHPATTAMMFAHDYLANLNPAAYVLAEKVVDKKHTGNDATERLAAALDEWGKRAWKELGFAGLLDVATESGNAGHKDAATEATLAKAAGIGKENVEMFPLDSKAADFLSTTGSKGRKLAGELREKAGKRWTKPDADLWRNWRGPAAPFWLGLATALWQDKVKPQLEREHGQYQAVTRPIFHGLMSTTSHKSELTETMEGGHGISLGKNIVATMPGNHIETLIRSRNIRQAVATGKAIKGILGEAVKSLQSLDAQRLLRFIILRSFQLWQQKGELDIGGESERIIIPGGYEQLASWTGSKGGKGQKNIKAALDALELIKIQYGGGNTVWLVQTDKMAPAPGRPASLDIAVNWPLLPVGMSKLKDNDALGVPIPAPNVMPPFVTKRNNDRAKEAQLHLRVMAHAAEHSPELAERGGIESLNDSRTWSALLDASGIPSKYIDAIREAYFPPAGGLFPVLEATPSGLVYLADSRANDFLVEQGQRRITGSKGGKKSARNRKPKAP